MPVEPWGEPHRYEKFQNGSARLVSLGSDRDVGGDHSQADVECRLDDTCRETACVR